jgi:hypothetical protein
LNIEGNFPLIITLIGGLGILFSVAWLLVNYNGNMWMKLIKSIIMDIEDGIFDEEHYALYHRIMKKYEEKLRNKFDVVNISIGISWLFLLLWLIMLTLALFFSMNHSITTYPV